MSTAGKIPHAEIVHIKLNDEQMRDNLARAMHTLQRSRAAIVEHRFTDWQGLRERARQAKDNALQSLEERLLEFERNAVRNGMQVHWADSAEDACAVIHALMAEKKITRILKGKSMASEEIGLNAYLQERGIQAVETDLGELIIQLNAEAPVHIVVPAIHKNRRQVGEIFRDRLGAPPETEIEKLNGIARTHLRQQFEELRMGLSGVNFAISREGAIWLIENEGNGRMCTTACDIHVAVCGIEKVVETFEDAATLVHLLTPSATGQFIPAYNNIITGPRRGGDKDGPRELHIVLFNHHRSDMLAHEDYQEALRCIRCGTCMNFCPVYNQIGGHAYQSVYPGPIGEVISPHLFGMDQAGDMLSFCSMCGRCSEVCPVRIPLHHLIRRLRMHQAGQGSRPSLGTQRSGASRAEELSFRMFVRAATSGRVWRFNLSAVHTFSWILHAFEHQLPVIRLWSKYREVPEIKASVYEQVKNMPGVDYE